MIKLAPTLPSEAGHGRADLPLHVVHGVNTLDVGGLERIVVDLVRMGHRRGQRVSVLCLGHPGTLACAVEDEGAKIIALNKPPGRTRTQTARVSELLTELKPDILHTHTIGALWHLGPAAQAGQVPVLHTEHIDNVGKAPTWWAKLKTRILWHRAARAAGRFCCVSDYIAQSAGKWFTVPRSRLDVVLNGIDVERYAVSPPRGEVRARFGIPSDCRVIGTVARLAEVKRQDLLIQALAQLGDGYQDVRVLLVGDGPERGPLERLAADIGVSDRVHFAGYQPAPEQILPAMDVFALSSRLEGLPLSLLEAWATGLPVISSAVGGIPKVVRDNETGLLFPSGDLKALIAALRKVLTDQAMATRMAAAGQRLVRACYSLERMASEYETRYRELLTARRQS